MSEVIRKFQNLSPHECLAAYTTVMKNANRHFKVSQTLQSVNEFPNAIAHLILSTEELIKAMVLFLDRYGFNLRKEKMISRIFHDHDARHFILRDIFSVYLIIKPLVTLKKRKLSQSKFDHFIQGFITVSLGVLNGYSNHRTLPNYNL